METTYAQAVAGAVARGMAPTAAAERLKAVLAARGHEQLLPRIGRELERLSVREAGRGGVTLTVARQADEQIARQEVAAVLAELGVSAEEVGVATDESIIGGWRVRAGSTRVDASYKQQLLTLYRSLTA